MAYSWKCDAHCKHCFIPTQNRRANYFEKKVVKAALENISNDIKVVSITGGEPFFDIKKLEEVLYGIKIKKRAATVVTNGLWFSKRKDAIKVLRRLYQKGLRGISVSIDDYHRPRISVEDAIKLIKVVRELGMTANVRGAGKQAGEVAAKIIRTGVLEGQENPTYLFGLENTGCAEKLPPDKLCRIKKNDYCFLVTRPFVIPQGDVYACCSIRVMEIKNDVLRLGNVFEEPLYKILERAKRNYLLAALAVSGPKGLADIIEHRIDTRKKSRCQVCLEILNNPKNVKALVEKISSSKALRKDIAGRMLVWETCYRPELLPQFQGGI